MMMIRCLLLVICITKVSALLHELSWRNTPTYRDTTASRTIIPPTTFTPCCTKFFTKRGIVFGGCIHTSRLNAEPTNKSSEEKEEKKKGIFDFVLNPYPSKIPEEIRREIYEAEANTPAAKERGKRIALYATVAFIGVVCAFFNVFLSELRNGTAMEDGFVFDIEAAGFGWVNSNFLFQFLFTNKIGGGICLLGGAACGLLAEAEFDTRRINSEKIYEEMLRRRAAKLEKDQRKVKKPNKKRRSNKEMKRLGALAEVILDDEKAAPETTIDKQSRKSDVAKPGGIVEKIKEYYQKADSMAATQALLLNKKLEDEGLIEKITDESGLRVIGLEAAAKLKEQKSVESKEKSDSS